MKKQQRTAETRRARRKHFLTKPKKTPRAPRLRGALLPLLLLGCTATQPPPGAAGPAEAVQEFAAAMQKGDSATAWALLSTRSQAQADAIAARARAAAGGAGFAGDGQSPQGGASNSGGPESGRQMLFQSALPGRPVEARVVSQSGYAAEVQTTEDGGVSRTWHVVREGGRWRVDLDLGR